jgi:hypothetical protein
MHTSGEHTFAMATLQKTILDYLYLHSEIDSREDFEELRRDRQELL